MRQIRCTCGLRRNHTSLCKALLFSKTNSNHHSPENPFFRQGVHIEGGSVILTTYRVVYMKDGKGIEMPLCYVTNVEKSVSPQVVTFSSRAVCFKRAECTSIQMWLRTIHPIFKIFIQTCWSDQMICQGSLKCLRKLGYSSPTRTETISWTCYRKQ